MGSKEPSSSGDGGLHGPQSEPTTASDDVTELSPPGQQLVPEENESDNSPAVVEHNGQQEPPADTNSSVTSSSHQPPIRPPWNPSHERPSHLRAPSEPSQSSTTQPAGAGGLPSLPLQPLPWWSQPRFFIPPLPLTMLPEWFHTPSLIPPHTPPPSTMQLGQPPMWPPWWLSTPEPPPEIISHPPFMMTFDLQWSYWSHRSIQLPPPPPSTHRSILAFNSTVQPQLPPPRPSVAANGRSSSIAHALRFLEEITGIAGSGGSHEYDPLADYPNPDVQPPTRALPSAYLMASIFIRPAGSADHTLPRRGTNLPPLRLPFPDDLNGNDPPV